MTTTLCIDCGRGTRNDGEFPRCDNCEQWMQDTFGQIELPAVLPFIGEPPVTNCVHCGNPTTQSGRYLCCDVCDLQLNGPFDDELPATQDHPDAVPQPLTLKQMVERYLESTYGSSDDAEQAVTDIGELAIHIVFTSNDMLEGERLTYILAQFGL